MRTLLLSSLFALAACAGGPEATDVESIPGELDTTGKVMLKVGDQVVTDQMIESITKAFPPAQLEQMKASGQFKDFLEQVALGQVLYQQAITDKLHEEPEVQVTLALAQRDALAKAVIGRIGDDAVTDEKLQEAYDSRKVQYATPQVRARHILVKEEAEAAEVMDLLAKGADFGKLAEEKSTDKASAARGGDLNWFKKGQMVPEFSEAAFGSTADEVIGPVKSKYGYHILQVTDRRDAIPLEEVKDALESSVKQEVIRKYIDDLKASMTVEWVDDSIVGGAAPEGEAEPAGEAAPH